MNDVHTGGCVCGAVRYRVTGQPAFGVVCHCRFCQRRLASAFAVVAQFEEKNVAFTQGDLREYKHRSDESGRWIRTGFCPVCGTTLTHTGEARPGMRAIAAGTFDDPAWFEIDRHIWMKSKLPWVAVPEGVTCYERGIITPST